MIRTHYRVLNFRCSDCNPEYIFKANYYKSLGINDDNKVAKCPKCGNKYCTEIKKSEGQDIVSEFKFRINNADSPDNPNYGKIVINKKSGIRGKIKHSDNVSVYVEVMTDLGVNSLFRWLIKDCRLEG